MQVPRLLRWDNDLLRRCTSSAPHRLRRAGIFCSSLAPRLCKVFPMLLGRPRTRHVGRPVLVVAHSFCLPAGLVPQTETLLAFIYSLQTCLHCHRRRIMPGSCRFSTLSSFIPFFLHENFVYVPVTYTYSYMCLQAAVALRWAKYVCSVWERKRARTRSPVRFPAAWAVLLTEAKCEKPPVCAESSALVKEPQVV